MLLIEQVCEKNEIKSDYIRCPVCGGRLCDKPVGEKAKTLPIDTVPLERTSCGIIIKCYKCRNRFLIQITNK